MNNLLHVAVDTDEVDQTKITQAIKQYENVEYLSGTWLVKTEKSPTDVLTDLRGAVGNGEICILPVNGTTISNAVMPDDVRAFLGISKAA
jgi:hypothetical protein